MDASFLSQHKPWWLPFFSLCVTLYGIFFLNWHLQSIIIVFWWEIIFVMGTALIRMLFAMNSRPFWETIFIKMILLSSGIFMGGAFILLSLVTTVQAMAEQSGNGGSFGGVLNQIYVLAFAFGMSLTLHFFMNGRYKSASPLGELLLPMFQTLLLLGFLAILALWLIPTFPQLNQLTWVSVAIVGSKFAANMLISMLKKPFQTIFEKNG